MTTDLQERIAHWKEKEGYTHSKILYRKLLYKEALELEKEEAVRRGCRYHGGGERVPGRVWSVYYLYGSK